MRHRPLLLIDVDGVISLFGFDQTQPPPGSFVLVDGIPHLISQAAGDHLRALASAFELAWCTGWEEKADEYLPALLGLTQPIPHLVLGTPAGRNGHWKLAAIDAYAGRERPLAWLDDGHDESCADWAAVRPGPTLLVSTDPAIGLTSDQARQLLDWAKRLSPAK